MANTYLDTYAAIGNREDLINLITNISYQDTVFMSRSGRSNVTNKYHEWTTEILQASNSANAVVEGATAAFASTDITVRSRLNNYTQILRKPFSTSYTEESMNPAGVAGTEFAHQRELKTKELARDMNTALINQASASGDSGTARKLNGVLAAITTNTTDGSNLVLDQNVFNETLQAIWLQGGIPNAVYTHGFNKRQISGWASPSMPRAIDAAGKKIVAAVDIYDSDFGRLMILLEREMPTNQIAILQEKYWKTGYLRPLFFEELGKAGGVRRGYVESEITLEYLAENSSGKITNLKIAA